MIISFARFGPVIKPSWDLLIPRTSCITSVILNWVSTSIPFNVLITGKVVGKKPFQLSKFSRKVWAGIATKITSANSRTALISVVAFNSRGRSIPFRKRRLECRRLISRTTFLFLPQIKTCWPESTITWPRVVPQAPDPKTATFLICFPF
ncbi:unannotated protein [freshwater metagenome]|uniref:Unannotated protein n=1 Tax=freshwater metagenome TaxID=449393 RepID=A0A6J7JIN3_9ZZZZ